MVIVRTATTADAEALVNIYAPSVTAAAVSFETEVPPVAEFESRIAKCLAKFPWIVCEANGVIAGYVYASAHRDREAYQWTCECSVYLHSNCKGKGIGKELYEALFQILKRQGFVNLYAGITLPNHASIKLHERMGFEQFATYHNVGYKFGSWHKVGWWRLRLNNHEPNPAPPLLFANVAESSYAPLYTKAALAIERKLANN